jgi:alpha-galactosidase
MKSLILSLIPSLLLICLTGNPGFSQDIAPTPPMGWMSWNQFEGDISESVLFEIADALVESGLAEAGYKILSIDDHWEGGRTEDGFLYPDSTKFPNGMKVIGDYLHSKGLKFGIYTDIAEYTCGGEVGSYGYEKNDAQTFASWGVDFIKCDYCGAPPDIWSAVERYKKFIDEVRKTDREIVFAICEWGARSPWLWGKEVGGNMWRTTWDSRDTWEAGQYDSGHCGVMEAIDKQAGLSRFAGPGHWNDPDMLMVGLNGKGKSSNAGGAKGMTTTEYESQMSLWCLMAAPLIICNDVRTMDAETKRILLNKELIEINQDPAGFQGERVWKNGVEEVWAKRLENGDWALGFLNRDNEKTRNITLDLRKLRIKGSIKARDLWAHKDIGSFGNLVTLKAKPHETRVIRISQN